MKQEFYSLTEEETLSAVASAHEGRAPPGGKRSQQAG